MLKIGHKIAYIQAARCHNLLRNNREVVRCHNDHLLLAGRKGNKNKSQRLKSIVARWLENRATPGGGGGDLNLMTRPSSLVNTERQEAITSGET